jgi:DNA polymerase-3 subunit delta
MGLTLTALEKQLAQKKFSSCYLLTSNEPFLLQEAREIIWKIAQHSGFMHRSTWELNAQLDWRPIYQRNSAPDLFCSDTIIDLRCEHPPEAIAAKAWVGHIEHLMKTQSAKSIIIISIGQWTMKAQQSSWFPLLAKMSVWVSLQTPTLHNFPGWLKTRLHRVGLDCTPQAFSKFCELMEGNVLAAIQTIQRLQLIIGNSQETFDLEQLNLALDDQATFELANLTEAILRGHAIRCTPILKYLQSVHTPPALVLGYLVRILRTLSDLHDGLAQQKSLSELFKQYAIWAKQQAEFKKAVERLPREDIPSLFYLAHQADRLIKGASQEPSWRLLEMISLHLAGQPMRLEGVMLQY